MHHCPRVPFSLCSTHSRGTSLPCDIPDLLLPDHVVYVCNFFFKILQADLLLTSASWIQITLLQGNLMVNCLSLSWLWYSFLITFINVWTYLVYYFLYLVIIGKYFHVNKCLVSCLHLCVPNHTEITWKSNSMHNSWINEQVNISAIMDCTPVFFMRRDVH